MIVPGKLVDIVTSFGVHAKLAAWPTFVSYIEPVMYQRKRHYKTGIRMWSPSYYFVLFDKNILFTLEAVQPDVKWQHQKEREGEVTTVVFVSWL